MSIARDETGTPISYRNPMPVDPVDQSSRVTDVSSETVQFVVASTNSNDAGEAAGVVVYGRFTNSNILNSSKSHIGNLNDSSVTLTSTALTTEVAFPYAIWHKEADTRSRATKMAAVGATLSNGEFCIDYASNLLIGKKTDTTITGTADYSYRSTSSTVISGGGGDASAANQTSMINLLTTIDTDTSNLVTDNTTIISHLLAIKNNTGNILDAVYHEDTQHVSGDFGILALAVRNDTLAALAGTDGDRTVLQVDANGALYVNAAVTLDAINDAISTQPVEPSNGNTTALATNLVIKASAGTLYEFAGFNTGPGQYIQLHDAASLPADTAVPEVKFWVPANASFSRTFPQGLALTTGIVVCNSSTLSTKTVGSANCEFDATYL